MNKQEMKDLAKDIRVLKTKFKLAQRKFSLGNCNIESYVSYSSCGSSREYEPMSDECNKIWNKVKWLRGTLAKAQRTYRLNHIENSLKRGTPYEKIESNPYFDPYYCPIKKDIDDLIKKYAPIA